MNLSLSFFFFFCIMFLCIVATSSYYLLFLLGPYQLSPLFAHLCMKCSLGISNFLEEISSLSHSIVFFYFFLHWWLRKVLLSILAVLWNSAFKWVYLSFSPLPLAFLLFSAICKTSSDNNFAFLHFFFLGMFSDHCLLYSVTNLHPQFFRHSVYKI